jgi:pimeloyl-ACP methyl ester carboxylesterase
VLTNFAQDLPADEAELIAITQGPWNASCIDAKVTHAAWHDKPVRTVISEADRMIPPALQEQMASAAHADIVRVPASHVVMLSHPEAVADVIIASAMALE